MTSPQLLLSVVLATHNRKEIVLHTLDQLDRCGMDRSDYEILVVDNASSDGTPQAVEPRVDRLIRLTRNAGSCAKAYGAAQAQGRYVLFLDDDSFPRPGSLDRMVAYFERGPGLGAAGFRVHLPDGREEGAALPHVFVGCGVGLRGEALRDCGGLDPTFFMQAEEYDLSFRLAARGWNVEVFDDLHVEHLKSAQARRNQRTAYYDIRNNLRVMARYLPRPNARIYSKDAVQRYGWLALRDGNEAAHARGRRAGTIYSLIERWRFRHYRLDNATYERFFCWSFINDQMSLLANEGVRRIVLADLGKNIYPFVRAALMANIEIRAIGDDRFAAPDRFYRGIPVLPLNQALSLAADAVVVSSSAPVFAVRANTEKPVYRWFDRAQKTSASQSSDSPVSLVRTDVVEPTTV